MESSGRPSEITLINIPWYDVLFKYVFTRLSFRDLFHLRRLSTDLKLAVSEYFKCNKCVDLTEIYDTFNDKAFSLATREASCIRYLFLKDCKWITDDCIISVLEKNENILHFDISGCSAISGECIEFLAINAKNLQKLYLKNCYWISSSAVTSLAIYCSDLEYVDLTSCEQVTDEGICKLVSHCPRLKFLSISQMYGIRDVSLCMIARKCKLLEELDLSCCYMVTDYGIKLIGELCESLKFLKVGSCKQVTELCLASLRLRMHVDQEIISTRWSFEEYIQSYIKRRGGNICSAFRLPIVHERPKKKGPIPPKHQVLQDIFEDLRQQCQQVATNPQTKRKLEDVAKKLENLYDRLRKDLLSQTVILSLHQIIQAVQKSDYQEALSIYSKLVSAANFSEISVFMPSIKVLLQTASQLGVYLQ